MSSFRFAVLDLVEKLSQATRHTVGYVDKALGKYTTWQALYPIAGTRAQSRRPWTGPQQLCDSQ